jgi:hypothetical protein
VSLKVAPFKSPEVEMNAANLALRFLLELAAMAGLAAWAWNAASGWWRFLFALLIVVVVMVLWTVFAVPEDPSRSGNAPVPIRGLVRLILELAILLGGAYAWHLSGYTSGGVVISALVLLHYLLSFQRIMWLLQQ